MSAIEACRTAALGGYVARCENPQCARTEWGDHAGGRGPQVSLVADVDATPRNELSSASLVRQGGFVHSLPAALRNPKQEYCGERDGSNEAETQSSPSYREVASDAHPHGPVEPPKAIKFYVPLPQSCDDLDCRFLRII